MPKLRLLPPVTVVDTREKAISTLEYLMRRGGRIGIDTETTGLDKFRSRVLFWSMATTEDRYSIPAKFLPVFDPLFRNLDISWILANAKFDMHMLANMGITMQGPKHCIFVSDHQLEDTRQHGLKAQSMYKLGASWGDFKDLFLDPTYVAEKLNLDKDDFRAFKKMSVGDKLLYVHDENPMIVHEYASCDAYFTLILGDLNEMELGAMELPTQMCEGLTTQLDYYNNIEVPLTQALWKMERRGFPIDLDQMKKIGGPMKDRLADLHNKACDLAGREFNPRSGDQLKEILYDEKRGFGLPKLRFTEKGAAKTDKVALQMLEERLPTTHPAFKLLHAIKEINSLSTLYSTYVKKIGSGVSLGPTGSIHCSINQHIARTSRLTTRDPSLQNIPIRSDMGRLIRTAFTAPEGHLLLDADYPQIEFRIAAFLASEEKMMEAFRKGWDIHAANASNMYGVDYDAIVKAKKLDIKTLGQAEKLLLRKRDEAKTGGLASLYGEGARSLAVQLDTDEGTAQGILDAFFQANPNIENLISHMHEYAHEHENSHTMLGRLRQMHKINNEYMYGVVLAEERQAFNHLVQGTGSEMIKLAILRAENSKDFESLGGGLIMTVHDELIASAPEATADDAAEVMQLMMAEPFKWGCIDIDLPISVKPDVSLAKRWADAK